MIKKLSISIQIILSILIILLVSVFTLTMLNIKREQKEFNLELEKNAFVLLNTIEKTIGDYLYFMDADALSDVLKSLGGKSNIIIFGRIYDPHGVIIADAYDQSVSYYLKNDELGKKIISSKKSITISEKDKIIVGKRIQTGNQILGGAALGLSKKPLQHRLKILKNQNLITAIFLLIIGSLFGFFISKSITVPLEKMVEKTKEISKGNFDNFFDINSENELGELANAMNDMMLDLSITIRRLRKSEERYTNAVNGANDGIWDWDLEFNRIYFSPRWKNIIGFNDNEFINDVDEWFNRIHKSDKVYFEKELYKHLDGLTDHFQAEYRIKHKDGTYKWVLTRGLCIKNNMNSNIKVAGSQSDITERKMYEEKLEKSLQEKDILLKEIHHRVKNNLAIIRSLLKFQSKNKNYENINDIILKLKNRIASIALIHDELFTSKDLLNIDGKKYIEQLVNHIQNSFGLEGKSIDIKINFPEINLNINKLRTCGLIINELLTNSIKHAFPKNKKGEIDISITQESNNYILKIEDNGKGFSEIYDLNSKNYSGLNLVKILLKDIQGTIQIENKNGVLIVIKFPT